MASLQNSTEKYFLITKSGRGVFAAQPIRAGSVIEISPMLILPLSDAKSTETTVLQHYT